MTEIVKGRKLHFLSGVDKNGSLVSIASTLAVSKEIVRISPIEVTDFNTELVVVIDKYPGRTKLPNNVTENERYETRTVVYNRLPLPNVLGIEFKTDENGGYQIPVDADVAIEHPLTMDQFGLLIATYYGYDINKADTTLIHVRDNVYTLTSKPTSLGYTGTVTVSVGDFVEVEPGGPTEPEVPVEGIPTESYFFKTQALLTTLVVNGIETPIANLYKDFSISVSVWNAEDTYVYGLVNLSTNILQLELPNSATKEEYNINDSTWVKEEGATTFKLSPLVGAVTQPQFSDTELDVSEMTIGFNVEDTNALNKLVAFTVDGELIDFAASFENDKISIDRLESGSLVVKNKAYDSTAITLTLRTASLGASEGILFGTEGLSVSEDGYEILSVILAAAAEPEITDEESRVNMSIFKQPAVYDALVEKIASGQGAVTSEALGSSEFKVTGLDTDYQVVSLNIRPHTTATKIVVPFDIPLDAWNNVNALSSDTVVGELIAITNGASKTTTITIGMLSSSGVTNTERGAYTFGVIADLPLNATYTFNVDFDGVTANRYSPTTTTIALSAFNYVETWITPEIVTNEVLSSILDVPEEELETALDGKYWFLEGGSIAGSGYTRDVTLVYTDQNVPSEEAAWYFRIDPTAAKYIREEATEEAILCTFSLDGNEVGLTRNDMDIRDVVIGEDTIHILVYKTTPALVKATKVITVSGDLDGAFNQIDSTGIKFENQTYTFNYTLSLAPAPAIPSPVIVVPATQELIDHVVDGLIEQGDDGESIMRFGQYEEVVEREGNEWTVTAVVPFNEDPKVVLTFLSFPKDPVVEKLKSLSDEVVVFRVISGNDGAFAWELNAEAVLSLAFEIDGVMYLPISEFTAENGTSLQVTWGVDFDGTSNFYSETAISINLLLEMAAAPSASLISLVDIDNTELEHDYAETEYLTFNGKDHITYTVNQLGSGLSVIVPFSIPVEAQNIIPAEMADPDEVRIVAKLNDKVVGSFTVGEMKAWPNLSMDTANSSFVYVVPAEESVKLNGVVDYSVSFEADFDGSGTEFVQYTSNHQVSVKYNFPSAACPVEPVVIDNADLYYKISEKTPGMEKVLFAEYGEAKVTVNGLETVAHVHTDVQYTALPLIYKANSAFDNARIYPTLDTVAATIDNVDYTVEELLGQAVKQDGDYYFAIMRDVGTKGTIVVKADWDGVEYDYCTSTTTAMSYAFINYVVSLLNLPTEAVEHELHALMPTAIQPVAVTVDDSNYQLHRELVIDEEDKGKSLNLYYAIPDAVVASLKTIDPDVVVISDAPMTPDAEPEVIHTAGSLLDALFTHRDISYFSLPINTEVDENGKMLYLNVDWDGTALANVDWESVDPDEPYRTDRYQLTNMINWFAPLNPKLTPVESSNEDAIAAMTNILGAAPEGILEQTLTVVEEGVYSRHDVIDSKVESPVLGYVFRLNDDAVSALGTATDETIVLTINGREYTKLELQGMLTTVSDYTYLVQGIAIGTDLEEALKDITIVGNFAGDNYNFNSTSIVVKPTFEVFTPSVAIFSPVNPEDITVSDISKVGSNAGADLYFIPKITAYTGLTSTLKFDIEHFGEGIYAFPMIVTNDIVTTIRGLKDKSVTVLHDKDGRLDATAQEFLDLLVEFEGVSYYPFSIEAGEDVEDESKRFTLEVDFDPDAEDFKYSSATTVINLDIVVAEPSDLTASYDAKTETFGGDFYPADRKLTATINDGSGEKELALNIDGLNWVSSDFKLDPTKEYVVKLELFNPDTDRVVIRDQITLKPSAELTGDYSGDLGDRRIYGTFAPENFDVKATLTVDGVDTDLKVETHEGGEYDVVGYTRNIKLAETITVALTRDGVIYKTLVLENEKLATMITGDFTGEPETINGSFSPAIFDVRVYDKVGEEEKDLTVVKDDGRYSCVNFERNPEASHEIHCELIDPKTKDVVDAVQFIIRPEGGVSLAYDEETRKVTGQHNKAGYDIAVTEVDIATNAVLKTYTVENVTDTTFAVTDFVRDVLEDCKLVVELSDPTGEEDTVFGELVLEGAEVELTVNFDLTTETVSGIATPQNFTLKGSERRGGVTVELFLERNPEDGSYVSVEYGYLPGNESTFEVSLIDEFDQRVLKTATYVQPKLEFALTTEFDAATATLSGTYEPTDAPLIVASELSTDFGKTWVQASTAYADGKHSAEIKTFDDGEHILFRSTLIGFSQVLKVVETSYMPDADIAVEFNTELSTFEGIFTPTNYTATLTVNDEEIELINASNGTFNSAAFTLEEGMTYVVNAALINPSIDERVESHTITVYGPEPAYPEIDVANARSITQPMSSVDSFEVILDDKKVLDKGTGIEEVLETAIDDNVELVRLDEVDVDPSVTKSDEIDLYGRWYLMIDEELVSSEDLSIDELAAKLKELGFVVKK